MKSLLILLIALLALWPAHAWDDEDSSEVVAVRDLSSGGPTQFWVVNRNADGQIWAVRNLSEGTPFRFIWVDR